MSTTTNILRAQSAVSSAANRAGRHGLFKVGQNCYLTARAGRAAFLIDGDAYFKTVAKAMCRATRSILIIGWDFHSQTQLHTDGECAGPQLLGDFLNHLARRKRSLHVHVLIWDYPMLFAKGRELPPIYGFGWKPHRRVNVRYDDKCPVGASHHQKIVVIDDVLAFCGGLDLTQSRWDTPEHWAADPRRANAGSDKIYPPFHDVMMAVDGDAARALAKVAHERWSAAVGKPIPKVRPGFDPWPPELQPAMTDVEVAVSRTIAPTEVSAGVREVEALYLDMIAAAKRYIYIEGQYFTSDLLGSALAKRLEEPDGPEVIAILRLSTEGWLEAPTMGALRTKLLAKLRDADQHGRFHPFYPFIPGLAEGQCCDLHSKLIIVDDEIVQLGSANFCNRSMGLDTECNVAVEARGERKVSGAIATFINQLLAEHLEVPLAAVEQAREQHQTLSATIQALQHEGRSLHPFEKLDEVPELVLTLAQGVADPEKPIALDQLIDEFHPDPGIGKGRPAWQTLLLTALGLLALAGLWRYTPLAQWADVHTVTNWANEFARRSWAPFVVLLAYTPASIVLFPRPLITLFAVIAFGAVFGFAFAFSGILLAALVTYAIGRRLDRFWVRRIAGRRINRLTELMRKRGLLAVTAVRFVPIAPFAVVNVVAGAFRIRLRDFMGGSAIGILPGTLVATVFGDQLVTELRAPGSGNLVLIAVVLLFGALATWALRRWILKSQLVAHEPGHAQKS
jgi:phospholipase D1/2